MTVDKIFFKMTMLAVKGTVGSKYNDQNNIIIITLKDLILVIVFGH